MAINGSTVTSLKSAPVELVESLLGMAEHEQRWRHRTQRIAQISALIIALSFLAAATYLISSGHDAAGTILGSVDLVSLVTVFLPRSFQDRLRLGWGDVTIMTSMVW